MLNPYQTGNSAVASFNRSDCGTRANAKCKLLFKLNYYWYQM